MRSRITTTALYILLLGSGASGCVDSPSQPLAANENNNPLATSFDALAQDQMGANDVERSEEFRWAALALRVGVTPTTIEVTNDGRAEVYDAFVHGVTWMSLAQALRPPSHRSLVAWRRSGDLLQVILVGSVVDSGPVLHPLALRPAIPGDLGQSPIAGVKAAYFERGATNSSWVGVGGAAKVAEHPQPSACASLSSSARPDGVSCQLTRYGVGLNVLYARTRNRDSRELDLNPLTRRIIVPPQTVAGVKLVFNCISPSSSGC